jgi:hypothetical protein
MAEHPVTLTQVKKGVDHTKQNDAADTQRQERAIRKTNGNEEEKETEEGRMEEGAKGEEGKEERPLAPVLVHRESALGMKRRDG